MSSEDDSNRKWYEKLKSKLALLKNHPKITIGLAAAVTVVILGGTISIITEAGNATFNIPGFSIAGPMILSAFSWMAALLKNHTLVIAGAIVAVCTILCFTIFKVKELDYKKNELDNQTAAKQKESDNQAQIEQKESDNRMAAEQLESSNQATTKQLELNNRMAIEKNNANLQANLEGQAITTLAGLVEQDPSITGLSIKHNAEGVDISIKRDSGSADSIEPNSGGPNPPGQDSVEPDYGNTGNGKIVPYRRPEDREVN